MTPDANPTLQSIFGLDGRTALVTGSSRGIGRSIARGLSAAGAAVVLHARTEAAISACADELSGRGGRVWSIACDLAGENAGARLAEAAEEMTDGIDILVINASAQVNSGLDGQSAADFENQISVNLRSTVEMLQACLPRMASRNWGRVVSIGSINQARPKNIVSVYAATKAAQHNLIQSQAREYAKKGVLLNTIAPGLVDTDRNLDRRRADPGGWRKYARELNWMGREGRPDEIVGAAIYLASEACSFMTGETIFVTGGH